MSFQLSYRPTVLEEFYGNNALVALLTDKIKSDDRPRSYLFTGEPGTGKTTRGRILKEEFGVNDLSFFEYDTGTTRGIDTIRNIRENARLAAIGGGAKLFLLDECHQITKDGLQALLKLLEDGTPEDCYVVLCTSEFESIKPPQLKKAIKRRCFVGETKALNDETMSELLMDIGMAEGKDEKFLDDNCEATLAKIIEVSEGSPGTAVKILDSVFSMLDQPEAIEYIENVTVTEATVKEIANAIMQGKTFVSIATALKGYSGDVESLRRGILNYLNAVALNGKLDLIPRMILLDQNTYNSGKASLTCMLYDAMR